MEFGSLLSDQAALFRLALFASTARGRSSKRCHNNSPPYLTLVSIPTTARVVGKASSPGLASSATFGHTVAALLTDYAHGHLRQRKTNNNISPTLWKVLYFSKASAILFHISALEAFSRHRGLLGSSSCLTLRNLSDNYHWISLLHKYLDYNDKLYSSILTP